MAGPSAVALSRARQVLDLDPDAVRAPRGYLDLVGSEPSPTGVAQMLMVTRVVPIVYERWWRPALGRVMKGLRGPSMRQEQHLIRELLAFEEGATVLDVACGPGNYTRAFAEDVGEQGAVIGIDLSATMLARAVSDTDARQVVYVRADVTDLSFRSGSVDAVSCVAALHLFTDPWAALDDMARALRPGGRLAILTTIQPRSRAGALIADVAGRAGGVRIFRPGEVTAELADRRLEITYRGTWGIAQIVGARRSQRR
ncbi:MAG: class I SAM-dependent methyltransferase [Actinobacteria bacterium]|nr:class I SAM-dependent methyltransferase [Actinomycetota bacterium]